VNSCNILGVNIEVTNMKETIKCIESNLCNIKGKYICLSNVHTTVMSYEDEKYRYIQNNSFMSLPDGKPLSLICKFRGYKEVDRVTGPDLMNEIFKISEVKGYTHYFYGSTEETLDKMKEKISSKYPKIKIVGVYSPPYRKLTDEEDREIICNINNSKADFVWVGLGAPKQEIWMHEHKDKIQSLMIGVGAGFDYHAGKIKRAPMWMQKLSLEWLYRLLQEPKRLFKRYSVVNFKFLYYVITRK
jgi:N-acetylglucosaminyldiphosphoundecaprenol N-acetyl-beta-D-mannosaminyltransferase